MIMNWRENAVEYLTTQIWISFVHIVYFKGQLQSKYKCGLYERSMSLSIKSDTLLIRLNKRLLLDRYNCI
jgi:hypothetical protein